MFIPGNISSIVWGRDITALQSLHADPGRDAEIVARELGALLTDMRLMGDNKEEVIFLSPSGGLSCTT